MMNGGLARRPHEFGRALDHRRIGPGRGHDLDRGHEIGRVDGMGDEAAPPPFKASVKAEGSKAEVELASTVSGPARRSSSA
jgi:hypothetical protein